MDKSSLNINKRSADEIHFTVLKAETIELVGSKNGGLFVDATLGMGGHTEAILSSADKAKVFGIDQDKAAIEIAAERLKVFGERFRPLHGNFFDIADLLHEQRIEKVNGIVADLGVSSLQFDSEKRGFSFRFDAPLDMRMDGSSDTPTAADLIRDLDEENIANIIYQFGEERYSRRIARRIVEKRNAGEPIVTTKQLADLVERALRRGSRDKIHPATKTFQALRIAVNRELEILDRFIENSIELLNKDGVLAIITFHSLEDRIVKQAFRRFAGMCQCPPRLPVCQCGAMKLGEILTKKPIIPGEEELTVNARSRSAKLRAIKKL